MSPHNCEENRAYNCDGTTHWFFCTLCDADLGSEPCPEAGTWGTNYTEE